MGGKQNTGKRQGGNDDEVPPEYARREERVSNGVIGAKRYPALYIYDDIYPLSNVALFVWAPWFDSVLLDQHEFCYRYATNDLLPCNVP